jgi:hypothetical protein
MEEAIQESNSQIKGKIAQFGNRNGSTALVTPLLEILRREECLIP